MGTRADFYVGKGKDAEWLGSIAWDGDDIQQLIRKATTEAVFRRAVAKMLAHREDGTPPEKGWPWPWQDSGTTDRSYWFFDGKCNVVCWDDADWEFPNMKAIQNVTLGSRSGLIVLSVSGR